MTGFFFPIFNYIANNRWAQIVLTCGLILIVGRAWLWGHDRRVEARTEQRIERRAQKTATKIRKQGEKDVEKALEAGRTAPRYDDADSVPDDIAADIYYD